MSKMPPKTIPEEHFPVLQEGSKPPDEPLIKPLITDEEPFQEGALSELQPSIEYIPFIKDPGGWGCRYTVAILGFLGLTVSYMLRVNLSFAIVAMVKPMHHLKHHAPANVCMELMPKGNSSHLHPPPSGHFEWSSEQQGVLLGSFFWGYVCTQLPGGMLAEKYGGKWTFGIGLLIPAIMALLTPAATNGGGFAALIIVRIIQGIGEGVTVPALHVMIAQWTPPYERSRTCAFIYSGNQMGTLVALSLSGALINHNVMGGWEGCFYIFGILAIVWFFFWVFFAFDNPAKHPWISEQEKDYIQMTLGTRKIKHLKTPWRKILKCPSIYAIIIAHMGNNWGLYTLLTELPTYMKNVLHYDIKQNSLLSAMPYLVQAVVNIITSLIADELRKKKLCTVSHIRKIFNSIGHWGPAIALFIAAYSGCNQKLAVAMLAIAIGSSGAAWSAGFPVNMIDLSPNHAGVIMGISNTMGNLCGIFAPIVAGAIVNDQGSTGDWKIVFIIAAVVYIIDNLVYISVAKSDLQTWNDEILISEEDTTKKEKDPMRQTKSELARIENTNRV